MKYRDEPQVDETTYYLADGDRIRTGFLWFPKVGYIIDKNGKETKELRWLEKATWRETFFGDGGGAMGGFWQTREWLDYWDRRYE